MYRMRQRAGEWMAYLLGFLVLLGCSEDQTPEIALDATDVWRMPDAAGSLPGRGFTVTGLTRDGQNRIWAGNDGRQIDGDTTHQPSLVLLTDGMTEVTRELTMSESFPEMKSIQGIAFDGRRNGIWIASLHESAIRLATLDGMPLDEIRLSLQPNGLALDAADERLFVTAYREPQLYAIDLKTKQVTALFEVGDDPDQMHFRDGLLYVTSGQNGDVGKVRVWSVGDRRLVHTMRAPAATAIEGILVDEGEILISNDTFFHGSYPHENVIIRFENPL